MLQVGDGGVRVLRARGAHPRSTGAGKGVRPGTPLHPAQIGANRRKWRSTYLAHPFLLSSFPPGQVVEAAYECEWFYFKGDRCNTCPGAAPPPSPPHPFTPPPLSLPCFSLEPVDRTDYCSTAGFNALSHVLSEIVEAAEGCGIEVEQIHCEDGQGQFEVSYRHGPALQAADHMFLLKEIILGVGQKHGVRATFIGRCVALSHELLTQFPPPPPPLFLQNTFFFFRSPGLPSKQTQCSLSKAPTSLKSGARQE